MVKTISIKQRSEVASNLFSNQWGLKMNTLVRSLLAACLLLPSIAFAGGTSGVQTISKLIIYEDGRIAIIGATGAWENPDNCDASNRLWAFTADENGIISDVQAQFSASLIAAKLKANPVSFFLNGCIDVSGTTYPSPLNIRLEP